MKYKTNKQIKNFFEILGDCLFTWLPMLVNILCCSVVMFPWKDLLDPEQRFFEVVLSQESIVAILLLTYTIVIAKNNYDLNRKIAKRLNGIQNVNPDNLFVVRNELESLESIFEKATQISFSGGHLATVIISHQDELNNYLKGGNKARFILPNPLNDNLMKQYAENLMINMPADEFKQSVILSLKSLNRYMNKKLNVEVRLYDYIPAFGLQIIESSKECKIYAELYTLHTELSERLLFPISKKTSGEMYDKFRGQFDFLWDQSKEISKIEGLLDLLRAK